MKLKVIKRDNIEDGGFSVSCPIFPGCHSQGESIEEALKNIKEAIAGILEVLNEKAVISDTTNKILEVEV